MKMFAYIRMRSGLLRMIEKKKNENPSCDIYNFSSYKGIPHGQHESVFHIIK
jgi:hypothetical protein